MHDFLFTCHRSFKDFSANTVNHVVSFSVLDAEFGADSDYFLKKIVYRRYKVRKC